jgi:hypothetical protein
MRKQSGHPPPLPPSPALGSSRAPNSRPPFDFCFIIVVVLLLLLLLLLLSLLYNTRTADTSHAMRRTTNDSCDQLSVWAAADVAAAYYMRRRRRRRRRLMTSLRVCDSTFISENYAVLQ